MTREDSIQAILNAAHRPCPDIVPVIRFRNRRNGHTCGILGFPFNADRSEYDQIPAGFCFQDKNGTRYGAPEPTADALRERFESHQARESAELRRHLETLADDALTEQRIFWEARRR